MKGHCGSMDHYTKGINWVRLPDDPREILDAILSQSTPQQRLGEKVCLRQYTQLVMYENMGYTNNTVDDSNGTNFVVHDRF